jgi:hypothetical protein
VVVSVGVKWTEHVVVPYAMLGRIHARHHTISMRTKQPT